MKNVIFAAMLMVPTITYAASFDCTKASTSVEMTICEDEKLNKLDEELNRVYKLVRMEDPTIVKSQREWVKVRNKATSAEQLDDLHESRISILNSYIEPKVKPMVRSKPTNDEFKEEMIEGSTEHMIYQVKKTGKIDGFDTHQYTAGHPKWFIRCAENMSNVSISFVKDAARRNDMMDDYSKYKENIYTYYVNKHLDDMKDYSMDTKRIVCRM